MKNIKTIEELKSKLKIEKNIDLISLWDKRSKCKITCKCFCGNVFIRTVNTILLVNNPCGCIKRNIKMNSIIKKLKDEKNLEIISNNNEWKGKKTDIVKVRCVCGEIFKIKLANIMYFTNSCGCLIYQYRSGNKNYRWKGIGDLSAHIFDGIKSNAKIRNFEFNVTINDIWNIFIKQNKKCSLSGIDLVFNTNHNDRNIRTASLDRIDPNKGYTIDNIQWIHKTLNKMKMNLSNKEFIYFCSLIYKPLIHINENKSVNIVKHSKNFSGYGNISGTKFKSIQRGALSRNIQFCITLEELWNKFIEQRGYCALTGLQIEFKYKSDTASLDRINSASGYTKDNTQWVHKDINVKLKQKLSEKDLNYWCSLVYNHQKVKYL